MIEDFIEELKKKFEGGKIPNWLHQTGKKDILESVQTIYNGIKGGVVKDCVHLATVKFIKSIKPDIPEVEMVKGVLVIESIIQTVFCMMVSEGVLTKVEEEDKIVIHWEGKRG